MAMPWVSILATWSLEDQVCKKKFQADIVKGMATAIPLQRNFEEDPVYVQRVIK